MSNVGGNLFIGVLFYLKHFTFIILVGCSFFWEILKFVGYPLLEYRSAVIENFPGKVTVSFHHPDFNDGGV